MSEGDSSAVQDHELICYHS